jgi:hypothetical protein
MLDELRAVLAHCRPDATRGEYLTAIHDDNCLGKPTTLPLTSRKCVIPSTIG